MKKVLLFALLIIMTGSVSAQCDPVYGQLVINEFMARNVVFPDEFDEFDDWVEVHNTSDEPINLLGYFLSDKHGNRTRYAFPDTTLEPGGYILVWCDGQTWQGDFHAEFSLQGSLGERIVLVDPDTTIIDHFDFGPVSNTHSLSRYPNGHGPFRYAIPSPHAENNETDYQPLVINEFLARNNGHSYDEFGNDFAWIELYNNRDIPLNLGGYFLSDKSNTPTKYQFPEPTILASGGYIVVYASGIDGITEIWPFHTSYGLSGSGEYVHLYNKDTVTLDFVRFGQQEQNISEGRFENGLGAFRCLMPTKGETNDPGTVNITEYFSPDELLFSIYPVPATDFINIQLNDTGNGVIEVFSALGSHVAQYAYQGDGPHYIDISDYTRGVYLVRIGNNTKRIVVR